MFRVTITASAMLGVSEKQFMSRNSKRVCKQGETTGTLSAERSVRLRNVFLTFALVSQTRIASMVQITDTQQFLLQRVKDWTPRSACPRQGMHRIHSFFSLISRYVVARIPLHLLYCLNNKPTIARGVRPSCLPSLAQEGPRRQALLLNCER